MKFTEGSTYKRLAQRASSAGCLHEEMIPDPGTDNLIFRYSQDCDPILDNNRELQVHGGDGYSPSREWQRVASIPNVLVHKWLVEEQLDVMKPEHWARVQRKLNDPEYLYLRTAPGRV